MELLRRIAKEYAGADKKRKSELLCKYVELTGISREAAGKS